MDFEAAWARRGTIEIDGHDVDFLGREDLITSKLAVGRPQDDADVGRSRAANDGS